MDLELSDLDLDLSGITIPPARGARRAEVQVSYVGEITREDVALLVANPIRDVTTPIIQRLKTSHHHLARLLAEGRSQAECHLITGYSISRISLLRDDPAFQELEAYYAAQVREAYVNVHERLASLGLDVLEELQERLEAKPESFSHKELESLLGTTLDRAGFGPKSTQVHELGGAALASLVEDAVKEVRERENGRIKTLDATARPSQNPRTDESHDFGSETGPDTEGAEVVRLPSSGKDL